MDKIYQTQAMIAQIKQKIQLLIIELVMLSRLLLFYFEIKNGDEF